MKVKSLLSVVLLAGFGFGTTSAEVQYLVKDGALMKGVSILKYDAKTTGDTIAFDKTAPDGSPTALLTHRNTFKDVRFYVNDGIDLTKTWNIVVEYYFEKGQVSDLLKGQHKWPGLNVGFVEDTVGGNYTNKKEFSNVTFDVKFKRQADMWNADTAFVYSAPMNQSAKMLSFGWQRQVPATKDSSLVVYIKSIKLIGNGNKPFFAEDFEHTDLEYDEVKAGVPLFQIKKGEVSAYSGSTLGNCTAMTSYIPVYIEKNKSLYTDVSARRLYENMGTDGGGFYDCEILHCLEIMNSNVNDPEEAHAHRDGKTFFFIPTDGLSKVKKFNVSFIEKWDAKMDYEGLTASTGKDSLSLPFSYAFVDQPADGVTATLTPFIDTLKIAGQWTAFKSGDVAMDNSKKYLALVLEPNPYFSYVIDNIQLTAVGDGDGLSLAGATADVTNGVSTYAMGATPAASVETVLSDAKLSIYPNPSADVVTVNNEGVQSVVVYGLDGAVKASANGNAINVSNLAKGIYIVKAYTAEGVIAGSIIKK